MIVVRVVGTAGIIYASAFADILASNIANVEQCIALPATKTASAFDSQNQLIASFGTTVLFNICCNYSPIDADLRGYTVESSKNNSIVTAIVSSFNSTGASSVYPLGYQITNVLPSYVSTCEITIGIGYASNELDIATFKDENFSNVVNSIMGYLYAAPIGSSARTPGIKNRDQYLQEYNNIDDTNNKWHEYTPSIKEGDSASIVTATAGSLPVRALKLSRATNNYKPYFWFSEYATSDLVYEHQILVSVKADRVPMNVVLYAGDNIQVVTLTTTNWTMLKMDFNPKNVLERTSSVVSSLSIRSKNKLVKQDNELPSTLVIDGLYNFKIAIGIQSKGTLLITSLAVGLKESIGALDSLQKRYSIYPPESRPKTRNILPTFDSTAGNRGTTNTAQSTQAIQSMDTGLKGTYGTSIGSSSYNDSKPSYTDGQQTDTDRGSGNGSGSGSLSEVYDTSKKTSTLTDKAAGGSSESNAGYLDDVDDPSDLLTSDASAFSDAMSAVYRAKGSASIDVVPIIDEDIAFNYDSIEAIIEASDSPRIKTTLSKAVGLLKNTESAMRVFKDRDNLPKKYTVNSQVVKDTVNKINILLEILKK